jgi:translation initiation factor IF-3
MGIVSAATALQEAAARGMDLVKIAPQAEPPVCRIMDYGKFKFEQAKREREAKKNQKTVDIKELQLSVGIGAHDYNFKLGHAKRFLSDGDKVKVSIRFRGREMAHTALGQELLLKFADECSEFAVIEKAPKLEGRQMLLFLAPRSASPAPKKN